MIEQNGSYETSTIAEMTNGIILAHFEKETGIQETAYQSEAELENKMIENLISQGYERIVIKSNSDLYTNLKTQIEKLNDVTFSEDEWDRFLKEYLDAPNEGNIEKTRKIPYL